VAGVSNAETVPVTTPSQYSDNNPIPATTDITITVYQSGNCSGTPYGTGIGKPAALVDVTGAVLLCQATPFAFSADARIAGGTPGGCSAPASYPLPCSTTPKQPSIGTIRK